MSADKFVNKVQQKMDEVRFSPNPQVWVEVERRIREKKKRRVIIFWFLFGGLLLAGGGYFLFNQPNTKKDSITINHKPVSAKTENTTLDTNPEENKKGNDFDVKNETEKSKQEVVSVEKEKTSPESTEQPKQKEQKAQIAKTKPSTEIKNDGQAVTKTNNVPATTNEPQINKADDSGIIEPSNDVVKQTKGDDQKPIGEKKDKIDTVVKNDLVVEQVANESKKKKDSTRKNKWEIGLNGALGSTKLTKGELLDIGGAKSADLFSAPNSSTNNPSTMSTSHADSIPLKGGYWQLGVYAKRKIGKKTYFSTGLNIAAYTTKQMVGAYVDSVTVINNDLRSQTTDGFYRAGQSTVYKNRYYFIQVPLLILWQLNKGEKIPIVWENGFVPSFLIASDALVYDKSSKKFFKDKRMYNDFNLVYHTALGVSLFKDNKHPLNLGIFYNSHISMLQKTDPPNYNYLNSFGIKMNWVIKK
ncbi:MAG: hypothetical protein E6H07_09830 [Bacteroidetes bacterium]|nr:MAG: hypothetical protein E6H07_09830 [Bacteroidota bacterium]